MSLIRLRGGTVYDPRNHSEGRVADVWMEHGRVVEAPVDANRLADREFDVTGMVVMPGGVDIHSHIAGPKVNTARKMLPELRRHAPVWKSTDRLRSGTTGPAPSTFVTGYLYAGLGYTTAFDAAIPPLLARHAHEEFADTPMIDKGCFLLAGNHHYALERIAAGDSAGLAAWLGWMVNAGGGYGVKIVNPGGIELWKQTGGNAHSLDDRVTEFGITPREIIRELASAADVLQLPHPVHIHANQLGVPGNVATTLETMRALEGRRGHITHIQFHSYSGSADDTLSIGSGVPQLVEYVNSHPEISIDVGQVMFGQTISMTGDGPLGYFLYRATGKPKWFSGDTETETGCGIVPIRYRRKSLVHAIQFAIGLEWMLMVKNPWQVALSTDHPNGASFLAYPQIIALLMDSARRRDFLSTLPPEVRERTTLADLTREFTWNEIAIVTRAAPASMLGLHRKGHLGIGADADVAVYQPQPDVQKMFELPRYVFKAGELIIDDGEIRATPTGNVWLARPTFDAGRLSNLKSWFAEHYSIEFENYPLQPWELEHVVEV